MIRKLKQVIASLLVVCVGSLGMPFGAHAAMLPTEAAAPGAAQARIASFVERADVRAKLEAHGVSAAEVQARVAAMTDDEAALLAARMDEMPAASGVLGILVTVFLVLLITDILGFTKVFPFTKPIR